MNLDYNGNRWLAWAAWVTLLLAVLANTAVVAFQHGQVVAEQAETQRHLEQIDRRLDSIEQALRDGRERGDKR